MQVSILNMKRTINACCFFMVETILSILNLILKRACVFDKNNQKRRGENSHLFPNCMKFKRKFLINCRKIEKVTIKWAECERYTWLNQKISKKLGLFQTEKLTEPVEISFGHLIGKERTSGPK